MIFSLFKRKKKQTKKYSPKLRVDIHSHLIPGIDDGSQSMEESLTLLKGLEDLGYEKVITTPHIMSDTYRNNAENIGAGLKALQKIAKENGIGLQIEAAAEYYLDDAFYDELAKTHILSVSNQYILFESSYMSRPIQMEEMIFAIGEAGYKPMLAHPERYRYIKDPQKEYARLKELGVFFQVNLNSFGGHYGKGAKRLAHFLNEAGMIDFLGSDTHHNRQVEMLSDVFCLDVYHDIFKRNMIKNDMLL
ncbi:CpsB/CapC family capsule biosynthesis tyrosine phosphatase [Sulfurovum sp.]|uniref:tyrosine-protein phosphatase n=2 Tax=Sulfurovum sp. TaxID=1969726 RepID=UPI0025F056FA|nr:CpsB/CapC family capsule biosynthesis tyrosine phosphatase [Sulfurovum sp.]